MIKDSCCQVARIPLLRLDTLKYRERDYLENVFKFWQEPGTRFPISQYWDKRVRQHLGTRYDSRVGVFDWDYHMKLRSCGAEHITAREYKGWRNSGVAFTWLETEVTEPNLTLATGAIQVGLH
jgi:dynein assembly factor 3